MYDYSILKKYDSNEMYKVYDKWPDIARESYESELEPVNYDDIDHIVFAGMGGSGALGDIFSSILSKSDIHVKVVKGYVLPKTVDSNTVVVTTSVSGNTIEALTILQLAQKQNCKTISFSSNGKIEEYCEKYSIDYRKIKMNHSPRASFVNYMYSMLSVLSSIIPVKKEDIEESIKKMEETRKIISSENMNKNNISLSLANWITDIPLIYYPFGLQSAAIRFKNSLQENSKSHVIAEDIIEACHNGVVAWEKKSSVQPILLEGANDYIKTKERWRIIKEYFAINNIDYREIKSVEGSILSKLINMIYVLDYSSIYLAVKREIDPSPVNSIDFIKKHTKNI